MTRLDDKPIGRTAVTFADYMAIVTHPAVRLGFLDAQHGRPFDHDDIVGRIKRETPAGALKRLGWDVDLIDQPSFELAQYRYEEGRLPVISEGLKCKAWGHPDFPPRQVFDLIWKLAERNRATEPAAASPLPVGGAIIHAMRGPTPPLLERMRA